MIKLFLRPGNIETAIGVMSAGNAAALLIRPKDKQPAFLYCDTVSLANELRLLADQLNPPMPLPQLVTKRAGQALPGVTKMLTPLEVIEYFYQSEDLREHAEDVEEALSKLIPGYNRQLIADLRNVDPKLLFEDGQPVKGIQSRIGEMLNIPNAGQGNRRRIQAILAELLNKYSTTTLKTPENATKAA
jgi:hypothetical protein